jgi:hypothetical protein
MEEKPLCPLLHCWRQIYVSLEEARARAGNPDVPPPPIVFNMQGWMLSSDAEKSRRWEGTVAWARTHGFF